MHKKYPPVVVVDENDNEIGAALTAEVWQKGLYHRVASVFIVDDRDRMLLQLRGPEVKAYPGCWDQAAGEHVDIGQTYESTATDETAEELGLYGLNFSVLGTYRSNNQEGSQTINQFERVFMAQIPAETVLKAADNTELSDLHWFTPAELQALILQNPKDFTPGLLYDLQHYFPTFYPSNLSTT